MNETSTQEKSIQWSQILSLAALNAVVVFSWIAYNNYQPKVLVKFNFQELALFLAIAQAAIMVCIPPLAGMLGDYLIKKDTKNFVVFTTGISITAMVFMAVAFTVSGDTIGVWRSLLPFLIVVWLISMNLFISPANSMIEMFAPTKQLPIVMGVIVMITEMVAALEPSIIVLVDALGSTLTFLGGGTLIAISGYFFKRSTENISFERTVSTNTQSNFWAIILVGILFGSITGLLMNVFPELLKNKFEVLGQHSMFANYAVSGILALSALLALPFSKWAEANGTQRSVFIGLIGCLVFVSLVFITSSWLCIAACVALAACYSLTSVSAFPYALQHLSARQVTYGTGIFIGSTELVDQLLGIVFL